MSDVDAGTYDDRRLRPCPFCGAPASFVDDLDGSHYIECHHRPGCFFLDADTLRYYYDEDMPPEWGGMPGDWQGRATP